MWNPKYNLPYGPTGEVFMRYTLQSKTKDSRELLTIQSWIDKALRSVPGVLILMLLVVKLNFEISVDPRKLEKYNLTPSEVYEAVNRSNMNVGGDIIEK